MKKNQTLASLETIINLQQPDYDRTLSDFPSKEEIKFRRNKVNQLRICGYTNEMIAKKIGCGISTIEKDLRDIRERSKLWYEEEIITEFCQSLHDSIILCDNAIEDLQILYSEHHDLDSKCMILSKISEFEERKISLYQKTKSVQKYLEKL